MKNTITPDSVEKQQVNPKITPPLEEEELEDELELPPFQAINLNRNIFDRLSLDQREGINTAPSVFDQHCVFRTGKNGG